MLPRSAQWLARTASHRPGIGGPSIAQGTASIVLPPLPFRRSQRCRQRRQSLIRHEETTKTPPAVQLRLARNFHAPSVQRQRRADSQEKSSSAASGSKGVDQGKATSSQPSRADTPQPNIAPNPDNTPSTGTLAASRAYSPSPTSHILKQTEQAAAAKGPVRVTDKRSGADVIQAEVSARDAEKTKKETDRAATAAAATASAAAASGTSASSTSPQTVSETVRPAGSQEAHGSNQSASSGSSNASPRAPDVKASPTSASTSASASGSSSSSAANPSTSSSELLKQRLQQAQERLERPLPSYGLGVAWPGGVSVDRDGTILQAGPTTGSQSSQASGSRANAPRSPASGGGNNSSTASGSGPSGAASASAEAESMAAGGSSFGGVGGGSGGGGGMVPSEQAGLPSIDSPDLNPPGPSLEHLFDTRAFVRRLEQAGFLNAEQRLKEKEQEDARAQGSSGDGGSETAQRRAEVMKWLSDAQSEKAGKKRKTSNGKAKADATTPPASVKDSEATEADASASALSTQPLHHAHDPAEAIMELTAAMLRAQSFQSLMRLLDRVAVENQRYLFTAALSELRTELQVRARADAAALRSITTLLHQEVDGLSQQMKEDIEQMKHDIQVDMNNRKGEAKEEQNSLEQEIQDLNNRFTISLSDLKTEIEQSIKWDLTRRALALVFGCVAIALFCGLTVDALSKRKERQTAEAAAAAAAANGLNPASASTTSSPTSAGGGSGGLLSRRRAASRNNATTNAPTQAPISPTPAATFPAVVDDFGLEEQYETDQDGRFV